MSEPSCTQTPETDQPDRPVDTQRKCATLASVSKTYRPDVTALVDLNLDLYFGDLTAIIGANGSGKSTCLKALFGLLSVDNGSVRTLDLDPVDQSQQLHRRATYLPQSQAVDPEMTGAETLEFFASLYGLTGPEREQRVDAMIDQFGLANVANRLVGTYSGGLTQRLHLAIGLLPQPSLLLLDEPNTGLDPDARKILWETLRDYAAEGHAVITVTHDLDEVTQYATRVVLFHQGRVRVNGTPVQIIRDHGQQVLTIKLDTAPEKWRPLKEAWMLIEGVNSIETRDDEAVLQLGKVPVMDAEVLSVIQQHGNRVTTYRRESDLTSAFFQLTGERAASPTETPAGRRGRGGGRRRR